MARLFLRVVSGSRQGTSVPLKEDESLVIGRVRGDLRLDDALISGAHCRIVYRNGRYVLQDLGSTNGTLVDGRPVQDVVLRPGAEIVVGNTRLLVFDAESEGDGDDVREGVAWLLDEEREGPGDGRPPSSLPTALAPVPGLALGLKVLAGQDRNATFDLAQGSSTVGRSQGDVPLNDAEVSRQHAVVEVFGRSMVFVRDLGSTNGTYHNGRRVQVSRLKPRDTLGCGKTVMRLVEQRGT